MTVEAMTVESNSTANGTPTTFIGSCNVPYTINANPQYGVPVYSYNWSTGQTVQSFVDVQSANGTYTYTCTVTDACGQTSVSTVQVLINDCPLPVELISFTGQNKDEHNLLKWTTGSEINSDYFEIQKSENGFDFQTIGMAKGAGNSNREINYEFRDYDPFAGLNYYRLKQVDFNGDVNWSNVITVKVKGSFDLGVYPNPTKDEVTVSFEYNQSSPGEIRIIDMMGRTVYAAGLSAQKGQNNLLLDLSQHSKGLYFITITVEKEVYKAMVMKER